MGYNIDYLIVVMTLEEYQLSNGRPYKIGRTIVLSGHISGQLICYDNVDLAGMSWATYGARVKAARRAAATESDVTDPGALILCATFIANNPSIIAGLLKHYPSLISCIRELKSNNSGDQFLHVLGLFLLGDDLLKYQGCISITGILSSFLHAPMEQGDKFNPDHLSGAISIAMEHGLPPIAAIRVLFACMDTVLLDPCDILIAWSRNSSTISYLDLLLSDMIKREKAAHGFEYANVALAGYHSAVAICEQKLPVYMPYAQLRSNVLVPNHPIKDCSLLCAPAPPISNKPAIDRSEDTTLNIQVSITWKQYGEQLAQVLSSKSYSNKATSSVSEQRHKISEAAGLRGLWVACALCLTLGLGGVALSFISKNNREIKILTLIIGIIFSSIAVTLLVLALGCLVRLDLKINRKPIPWLSSVLETEEGMLYEAITMCADFMVQHADQVGCWLAEYGFHPKPIREPNRLPVLHRYLCESCATPKDLTIGRKQLVKALCDDGIDTGLIICLTNAMGQGLSPARALKVLCEAIAFTDPGGKSLGSGKALLQLTDEAFQIFIDRAKIDFSIELPMTADSGVMLEQIGHYPMVITNSEVTNHFSTAARATAH